MAVTRYICLTCFGWLETDMIVSPDCGGGTFVTPISWLYGIYQLCKRHNEKRKSWMSTGHIPEGVSYDCNQCNYRATMKGDLSHNILTDTYINWLSNSITYIWLSNVMCNINWAKISGLFCFCFRFLISPKYISRGVLCWKSSIIQHIYIHYNIIATIAVSTVCNGKSTIYICND